MPNIKKCPYERKNHIDDFRYEAYYSHIDKNRFEVMI
jgi:hypothetical protein